jgi:hypothetical protein
MGMYQTWVLPGFTALFILATVSVNGQVGNSQNKVEADLIGVWGMFKDKHPDGWGNFKTPYMYLEFTQDHKYNRIWLHNKGNSMAFGTYELAGDSLIIFHESIGTNGIEKGVFKGHTVKLYSIKSDLMEIWEDWDRVLSKRIKKWGHEQKYRRLTKEELENLEAARNKLLEGYALIKDTKE